MKSSLVAHRGAPLVYPENSLPGFEAALQAGAGYVETDVHISADGVPVLSHDPSLLKITGRELQVAATRYARIKALPAGYASRFGDTYSDLHIARLDEFTALLKQWPDARAFIEIKHASIEAFGIASIVDIVMQALGGIEDRCIIISFEYHALVEFRSSTALPVGWVLPGWTAASQSLAGKLQPDYLFCSRKRLPGGDWQLWEGPWKWVVYTINEPADVIAYREHGFDLVETDEITRLLSDKDFSRSCL
ncbi:MAG: glycerophosphodiester phosphodiesterase family protein [Gammaproteobacteria bacterium]